MPEEKEIIEEPTEEIDVERVLENWRNRCGAKSLYQPWMCEEAIRQGIKGKFVSHIAATLGVCTKTLYNWQDQYPEFKEAMDWAKSYSLAYHEEALIKGIKGGKGYNFAPNAFILSNKWKAEYSKSNDEGKTDITINNLNLSSDEIKEKIAQISEKLQARGQLPISFNQGHLVQLSRKEKEEKDYDDTIISEQ